MLHSLGSFSPVLAAWVIRVPSWSHMVAHNGVHVDRYRTCIPIRRRASACSRRKRGSSAVLVVATLMSHGALLLGATMNVESVYV